MLNRSTVHRKLDAKFKVGGMEAVDLFAVGILAAVMNLFFGRTSVGPIFIFGLPGILLCALCLGKRGKSDGYLLHALKYFISPGRIAAGQKQEDN